MKNKKRFEDDGRQIADMSGTYNNGSSNYSGLFSTRKRKKREAGQKKKTQIYEEPLTKRETRKIMFNAMLSGLLIGSVFIIGALLFILFALNVWLK